MHLPVRQQVIDETVRCVGMARPIVERVLKQDKDLASQIRRALSSVSLNLSEGFGVEGGNERLRFQTALGSLYEAKTAVRVAVAWAYVSAESTRELLSALERLGGRVYGLSRASRLASAGA